MKKKLLYGIIILLSCNQTFAQVSIDRYVNLIGAGDQATLRINGDIFVKGSSSNTFLGNTKNTTNTGTDNLFVGYGAGKANTTGTYNTFIGPYAGYANTTGSANTIIGETGYTNTQGSNNTFIGYRSGVSNQIGDSNVFIGYAAGEANSNGSSNVYIGLFPATYNSGSNNIVIGKQAGAQLSGDDNIILGEGAGYFTNANGDIFIGQYSGYSNLNGTKNVFVGIESGFQNTNGVNNTYLGYRAGYAVTTGSNNLFLGYQAGTSMKANITHSVVIGNEASSNQDSTMVFGAAGIIKRWSFGRVNVPPTAAFIVGNNSTDGNGAYLTKGGVWTDISDKNKKENFTTIDGKNILEKLATLSITQWNYKGENSSIKHIGPMAQDFYSLFHLGNDDKSISALDKTGVALIAIQELYKKNQTIEKQLEEINKLKADLNKLQNDFDLVKADNQSINQKVTKIEILLQKSALKAEE